MRSAIRLHKAAKDFARRTITRNDAVLHVHGGMITWVLMVLVVGDAATVAPLAAACMVECGNEILDRYRTGAWRWRETLPDLAHSLVWPLILFGLARLDRL